MGSERVKTVVQSKAKPVHGRVWFKRGTEGVTCSFQPGAPRFGTGELPQPALPTSVHPLELPAPSLQQFPLAVPRHFRLEPTATSPADDGYFGSTGGVHIFLFRLHFLAQPSTM